MTPLLLDKTECKVLILYINIILFLTFLGFINDFRLYLTAYFLPFYLRNADLIRKDDTTVKYFPFKSLFPKQIKELY